AVTTMANVAMPDTIQQPAQQTNVTQAIQTEKAKTAAAEAQLAAIRKAQAKAANAQRVPGILAATNGKNGKTTTEVESPTSAAETGTVSAAKMAQFNSAVDEARSLAKQVMSSGTGQDVQTAKNYDKYLKTLKASMRGIHSDADADRLIKQANQTKAYIQSLSH